MKHATKEPTRIRQQGRRVTRAKTGAEIIDAVRQIVESGSYAKINGVTVDHFSASAIMVVHKALNEEQRAKFEALPVHRMATISFKLLNR